MSKRNYTDIITPWGRAAWCSLQRPSYKFKPREGEFSARIVLPEGPETTALIAQLEALYDKAYADNLAEAQREKPKIASIKRADKPYKRPQDPDTGEELPGYQLNSRLKYRHYGVDEHGVEVILFTKRVSVQDSKKQPVRQEVGSGSIIRLALSVGSFYTAIGSGISLKLVGVQVKELVPLGQRDPGFDEVEGGFEEATASDPVEVTHEPLTADQETGPTPVEEWS